MEKERCSPTGKYSDKIEFISDLVNGELSLLPDIHQPPDSVSASASLNGSNSKSVRAGQGCGEMKKLPDIAKGKKQTNSTDSSENEGANTTSASIAASVEGIVTSNSFDKTGDKAPKLNEKHKNGEHRSFIKALIANGTPEEVVNYKCYLKILDDGLLEKHKGRYLYISKGKLLNKSFKRIHDIYEYIPPDLTGPGGSQASIVYVPINYNS